MQKPNKPATWFFVVGVVALLWNLSGIAAYLMSVTMSPEALSAMPDAERALIEATPAWVTGAFAVAVFGGTLGCIALLLRRRWALPVFVVSMAGIVAQMSYAFLLADALAVHGPAGVIMPLAIVTIGVFLLWFSRWTAARRWLT